MTAARGRPIPEPSSLRSLRRGLARGLALGLALASLGCASRGAAPAPEVQVPLPAGWDASATPELELASAPLLASNAWWRSFEDPSLDRLIDRALAANRDLRSAAARLDAALAQARIAGAAAKPAASLSTSGSRQKQNFIGLPIPGAEDRVLSNTSTSLGVSLNVSWETDLWGRLGDGRRAARARAEAVAFDLEAARLSIVGQTAKAWFALLEASHQVRLAEETLGNRSRTRARIERRYRQGLRSALDLRLATVNEANAQARLAGRRRQLEAVRRQLEVLLARDAEALEILEASTRRSGSTLPHLPVEPDPDLSRATLSHRPELRASEQRLAAAGLDVAAARKLLYPSLTWSGATGTVSTQVEDLLDSDFSVWSLAAGLVQPLFQGGRLRAGVELSQAGERDLLARHESAVLRAIADIETQLADARHLAEQRRAVAAARAASSAAEALAHNRYFSGLSDYLSVLAAEDQATEAASQLLELDRLLLQQRVDLHLAFGGAVSKTEPADPAIATTEESK